MMRPTFSVARSLLRSDDRAALDRWIDLGRGDEAASLVLTAMTVASDSDRAALWTEYDTAWAWRRATLIERAQRAVEW